MFPWQLNRRLADLNGTIEMGNFQADYSLLTLQETKKPESTSFRIQIFFTINEKIGHRQGESKGGLIAKRIRESQSQEDGMWKYK